jgi:hypothetical protein
MIYLFAMALGSGWSLVFPAMSAWKNKIQKRETPFEQHWFAFERLWPHGSDSIASVLAQPAERSE